MYTTQTHSIFLDIRRPFYTPSGRMVADDHYVSKRVPRYPWDPRPTDRASPIVTSGRPTLTTRLNYRVVTEINSLYFRFGVFLIR